MKKRPVSASSSRKKGGPKPAPKGRAMARQDKGRSAKKADSRPATAAPAFTKKRERPPRAPAVTPALPAAKGTYLFGMHAVREAFLNPARKCFRLFVTENTARTLEPLIAEAAAQGLKRPEPEMTTRELMDASLPQGAVHQGVLLDVQPLPEPSLDELLDQETLPELLLVLDQVTDPHNIGAILRSGAAFGAGALIMTERNAPALTAVMAKIACGAADHVPQIHVVNLSRALTDLQKAGYWCVGLAEEGEKDLSDLDLTGRTALVLGAEGDGLRRLTRKNCDELARLPTGGAIGSLNVSNAAAVALYEARRQKKNCSA